ncbi:hypothetical protein DSO57_1014449 [Entomophthora muscae]|uniref:Uncharacterized protein n=1 Tax=Entomophthora muscae TaxID=34485 RepID=A0ACC2RK21_9FUNG|nr:hypothetical protein DSO57_1014449 [Entomophthora muscae]
MKLLLVVSGALGYRPFFPEVGYHRYVTTPGVVGAKSKGAGRGLIPVVRGFVEAQMGFKPRDYAIKDFYTSSSTGVSHVYLRQKVDGKEVFNGDMNINVKDGVIVSYGDSFYRCSGVKTGFPDHVSPAPQAMWDFLSMVGIEQTDPIEEETMDFAARDLMLKNISQSLNSQARAQLGWIQTAARGLVPVWDLQVELHDNYYHGHISTNQSQMLALADWRSHMQYRAAISYASDTSHPARVLVTDPHDPTTSPLGWHNTGSFFSSGTLGNNAVVMHNKKYIIEYNGNFDYSFDPNTHPSNSSSAAVTNLFYWINKLHDLFYHYGFNENAGNFQTNNFGRGGLGNDAVLVYAQDEENFNNAFFTTPPDGLPPPHAHASL